MLREKWKLITMLAALVLIVLMVLPQMREVWAFELRLYGNCCSTGATGGVDRPLDYLDSTLAQYNLAIAEQGSGSAAASRELVGALDEGFDYMAGSAQAVGLMYLAYHQWALAHPSEEGGLLSCRQDNWSGR